MTIHISSTFNAKLDDKAVYQAMQLATKEILIELYNTCVKTSPYDTGKLQESHSWDYDGSGAKADGKMKVGAKYWSYVEFGTSKMGARRWIRNGINSVEPVPQFKNYFKAHYHPPK